MLRSRICLALTPFLTASLFAANPTADLESRRKALNALLDEQWEYSMRHNPIFASTLGDKRYNDQIDDFSQEAIEADLEHERQFIPRLEAIDTMGFPDQEVLNKLLMIRDMRMDLAGARFKSWEMPVSQQGGVHLFLPQLANILPFDTVKDYDDYITRMKLFPRLFDQNITQMRKGMADGLMPPRMLLEKVATQSAAIANMAPDQSPFLKPFKKFPDSIPEADRARLREAGVAVVRDSINPAYSKFAAFVHDEYAPKGRTEPGVWSLPDGNERYAFRVQESTTTNLTPEEIHQIGLAQVNEIEGRMLQVVNQLGYKDMKSFGVAVKADPRRHPKSRQEILDLYTRYIDTMYTKLPDLFGHLPKGHLDVMPIEEFREKEASTHYLQGTPDGSRKAHVMVNTGDFEHRTTLDIETTAYHEGVPGHHLQIALAQELPELPKFRQQEYYTAYTEGWALYSERLGKEVGYFQDPYSYYGHLENDMLRAIRLVVDTGFHYKHWSRQQVVDFFHDHSLIDEPEVQSETDRYMANPAQALGYKIGQLEILKLRTYAKDQLGDRFDLRGFHDQILTGGALPMDILGDRIHTWVAQTKASAGGVSNLKAAK